MDTTPTTKSTEDDQMPNVQTGTDDDAQDETLDPRVARSRAKLLDASAELLIESGARSVTVDAVSERSGVAKSTLYRHFATRTELLIETVRACVPGMDVAIEFDDPAASLRALLHLGADALADPQWRRMFPAVIALKFTHPELSELLRKENDHRLSVLQSILDRGAEVGVFRRGLDAQESYFLLAGPMLMALVDGAVTDFHHIADRSADMFLAAHRP